MKKELYGKNLWLQQAIKDAKKINKLMKVMKNKLNPKGEQSNESINLQTQ